MGKSKFAVLVQNGAGEKAPWQIVFNCDAEDVAYLVCHHESKNVPFMCCEQARDAGATVRRFARVHRMELTIEAEPDEISKWAPAKIEKMIFLHGGIVFRQCVFAGQKIKGGK